MLLLAGLLGGRLAATTRVLPAITGYIAIGFLLGPGVLGWLTRICARDSRVLAEFSLGLIVFDLGRRLDLQWARHDRWLLPMGLAETALSFVAMFALLHFVADVDTLEAAVAAMVGTATAPAVVLLVTNELKAEGPATRRMLWHVALNNIIATIGVTLLLPFVEARTSGASWHPIARALWLMAGSFLLGFVAFLVMAMLARWLGKSPVPQFLLAVGDDRGHRRHARNSAGSRSCSRCWSSGLCARNLDRQHRLIDVEFGRAAQPLLRRAVRADRRHAASRPVRQRRMARSRASSSCAWSARPWPCTRSRGRRTSRRPGRDAGARAHADRRTRHRHDPADLRHRAGIRCAACGIVVSGIAILLGGRPIATRYALIRAGRGRARRAGLTMPQCPISPSSLRRR